MGLAMTNDEYAFLTDRGWEPSEKQRFFKVGEECYENGWIDNFGILTNKGAVAIQEFETG